MACVTPITLINYLIVAELVIQYEEDSQSDNDDDMLMGASESKVKQRSNFQFLDHSQ
jgi:hypothetical protein